MTDLATTSNATAGGEPPDAQGASPTDGTPESRLDTTPSEATTSPLQESREDPTTTPVDMEPANDAATTIVTAVGITADEPAADRPVEWAPAEPVRKKRRVGLWIGLAAGVLLLGAGAASTILIAPGVTVAGVPVGWMTPGAAAEAVEKHVSDLEIEVTGSGTETTVTGDALGARIDAQKLADDVFAAHPLWNVTAWMPAPVAGEVTLDRGTAEQVLRQGLPGMYTDPVDATVTFDPAAKAYAVRPSTNGTGVDLPSLTTAIDEAVAAGKSTVKFAAEPSTTASVITDDAAKGVADKLNAMLATVGFYVGDERTVPIDPDVAAGWLRVANVDGEVSVTADPAAIQPSVDALSRQVPRKPVTSEAIADSSGTVLETLVPGVTGRELGDLSGVAAAFAAQLSSTSPGSGAYQLPVTETPFTIAKIVRQIDVNLSTQTVSVLQNGAVVDSWPVSTGRGEFATHTGSYAVNWKLTNQNMGNRDLEQAPFYFQPDVKWVMYFNGDEAFHGVYWHSSFGTPMSHGCVGMPEWRAQWLYDWTPQGTEVNVHY